MTEGKISNLTNLIEVARIITSTLNLDELLQLVMEITKKVMKAQASSLMLIDEKSNELVFKVALGEKGEKIKEQFRLKMGQGIAGWVAKENKPLLVNDVRKEPRFFSGPDRATGFKTKSILCVPLKVKEKIIGVVEAINKMEGAPFTEEDIELFTAFSNQAAIAIENAKLYKEVKQSLIKLKETQDRLIQSEKMAALGKLASGVAHEVNNPMTSIICFAQMILRELEEKDINLENRRNILNGLKIIEKESKRCSSIVNNLRQFSRRSKSEEKKPTNVNNVIEDALAITEYQIKRDNINIIKEFDCNLPETIGDANQLEQVFINMITNARDAMSKGGTLTITTKKANVNSIEITFADTGCGIPKEIINEIFAFLFTTKEGGQGVGLGLGICQDIITNHKGNIRVDSEVGRGTVFTIQLPVAENKT